MSFTHLQTRSGYSLFDSTNTIERLVARAKELNFTSLALTDENVLYGAISFYQTCEKHGIKPIIGMTVNAMMDDQVSEPCILLAKSYNGYQQLIQLSTHIHMEQSKTISIEKLSAFTEGIICILPAVSSKLAHMLLDSTHERANRHVNQWKEIVKEGDFYLGINDHGNEKERIIQQPLKAFHQTTMIPVVAIQDVRYPIEADVLAYDCLQAMKKDERWSADELYSGVKHRHLRSAEEMKALFQSFWPEVVSTTNIVAEKCNVTFDFKQQLMPSYPLKKGQNPNDYLSDLCWNFVYDKYNHEVTDIVKNRLTYELDVIQSMKFSDYFLIVWDFITFAKNNQILVGPGRGSSAGSIVAYVLGITEVDPIKHDLLFERFLNPDRVTMPDIDIDFSDHRRDEVIEYVRQKYGEQHVAQIITFGTFAPRSVLRELIKTIGIDQQDAAFILKYVPVQGGRSIREYVRESEELTTYIKQSKKLQQLFSIATKLEGLPRHISTHAAGLVISEQKLTNYTPLTLGANDMMLTQFAMNELEAIGLLKIDLLGLRNLSLLERVIQSINYQEKRRIDLHDLPENDERTFELLQAGMTNGVFQLESRGMKQVLRQLEPTTFHDIVAVNALYRPGPMDYISTFIDRKNGHEKVVYPHENLQPILQPTFGVLVYQEQIMQIVNKVAGFTFGEADILRRAITTKKVELMEEQKERFIQGCIANGYEQTIGEEVFAWILKFSNYGFPKSHATAYSKISYQLAYFKAHYPAYFFAELLSSVISQYEKASEYIKEAKSLKIDVIAPSINFSIGKYSVRDQSIQMGLLAIKGIGYSTVQEIIRARKSDKFTDLFDFCLRVSLKQVNKTTIERLIIAGAFDELYSNRASLLASIDQAIEQGILFGDFTDQSSLLQHDISLKPSYTKIDDFSQMKKLTDEKELLGIYLSSHPLSEFRKNLRASGYITLEQAKQALGKREVKCAAIIQDVKTIRTKDGEPMAFAVIGDETWDMDAVVFPELYRKEQQWLKEENLVLITGKVSMRNHRLQMVLNRIQPFDQEQTQLKYERLFIKLTSNNQTDALQTIRQIAKKSPGNTPIIIHNAPEKKSYQLSENYMLNPSHSCLQKLKATFGELNVVLQK